MSNVRSHAGRQKIRIMYIERTAPRFTGLYAIGRGCILGNVALISLRSSETLNPRMPEH